MIRIAAVFILFFAFHTPVALAAEPDVSVFLRHDEASTTHIDYRPLDTVLRSTVWRAGPSVRQVSRNRRRTTGTRMSIANPNRSWLEGNRVFYHLLSDNQITAISDYRKGLEKMFDDRDFGALKRNEQLAYWLNLYNITVYEHIARRYPIVLLRRFHLGTRGKPGLWDQKLLRVAGVPLSLNDIEQKILIPLYNDPMVLYGLFQGAVGGPNIRSRAFYGDNVHKQLRKNAVEYVNSIRGVHKKGDNASVSLIYGWGRALFPDWEADLRAHMLSFADGETAAIVNAAARLVPDYFDWYIADLYNGRPKWTPMYANTVTDLSGVVQGMENELPPHVRMYLDNLRIKFETMEGGGRGRVFIEEIVNREDKDEGAAKPATKPATKPAPPTVPK